MLWDGDCGFCRFWIERWKRLTHGRVDYAPNQEIAAERFPEIPEAALRKAVHLVEPDGRVFRGAEAVFRMMSVAGWRWPLWLYHQVPGFARLAEWAYGFVAGHRPFFMKLTRLFFRGSD
jgi:predicted DCC family thiol-disulfide oxidoreductase YuxK